MTHLRPYQIPIYEQLVGLLNHNQAVCLAATTGFGKTEVAIAFIKKHPDARILVLAHAQTSLRRNFADRLAGDRSLAEDVVELVGARGVSSAQDFRVVVSLPQTVHKHMRQLGDFDFIIVDEAHQYFGVAAAAKKMYTAILEQTRAQLILLTASHYSLDIPKTFFSREQCGEPQ